MSEECNMEISFYENILWLKIKDTSQSITHMYNGKKILIEDLKRQVPKITKIRIVDNESLTAIQFPDLPISFIEILSSLIDLDLSDNILNDLPSSLSLLKNLQHLNLDCNKLSTIPEVIGELTNLKSLKMRKNLMREISISLENLANLEDLDLSFNILHKLPLSWKNLNLRNLNLASNKFVKIPDCIVNGMQNLRILNFSKNLNSDLDASPYSTNLTEFYAIENGTCPSFPTWLLSSKYSNLDIVSLDETTFKNFSLPEAPPNSNIKRISMKQCNLSSSIVQKIVSGMKNLEGLIVGNTNLLLNRNNFWFVPTQSLYQPSKLKEIDVCATGIPLVPNTISDFSNLSVLNVSSNSITWLPKEICSLTNLEILIINNNNLVLLPDNFGELVSLKELKACHNSLCQVPESFKFLNDLKFIDLYNNEFESIPEVIQKLPNLLGMDFEQNYFSTDDSSIDRAIDYENMRAMLREHWSEEDKIYDGPKVEPEMIDVETRLSSPSSSIDSLSNHYKCSQPERPNSVNSLMNERWDISEDSADEFDPNENREPRKRSYSPFEFYKPIKQVYCPAQLHQTRIATRVTQMLQNGTLIWPSNFEEGQFEDP